MFEEALAHEEKVTARIHDMASLALELKDHATYNFLQWFIAEQVEEEETAMDMVQKFKMAGEHPAGPLPARQGARDARLQRAVAARGAGRRDGRLTPPPAGAPAARLPAGPRGAGP